LVASNLDGSRSWNCRILFLDKEGSVAFPEASMALKQAVAVVACATLVALGAPARADGYTADEFLNLDLSKALLSPKRLGPPAEFSRVPVEARTDAKPVATTRVFVEPKPAQRKVRTANVRTEKPRTPARAKLARRPSNPLDANAMARPVQTTRIQSKRIQPKQIQTWPCASGGICNWTTPQAVYRID
jgi:hypothetical protein